MSRDFFVATVHSKASLKETSLPSATSSSHSIFSGNMYEIIGSDCIDAQTHLMHHWS